MAVSEVDDLDPTKPVDSDLVGGGNEELQDLKFLWVNIFKAEHLSTGEHSFPLGVTPATVLNGQLNFDSADGRLERGNTASGIYEEFPATYTPYLVGWTTGDQTAITVAANAASKYLVCIWGGEAGGSTTDGFNGVEWKFHIRLADGAGPLGTGDRKFAIHNVNKAGIGDTVNHNAPNSRIHIFKGIGSVDYDPATQTLVDTEFQSINVASRFANWLAVFAIRAGIGTAPF